MTYQKQKTPIHRILDIVRRLYAGERFDAKVLSIEYGVSSRTIYRDMHKIAQDIPLQNHNGIWSLDRSKLSKTDNTLNHMLLSSFAQNLELEVECLERSNLSSEKIAFAVVCPSATVNQSLWDLKSASVSLLSADIKIINQSLQIEVIVVA